MRPPSGFAGFAGQPIVTAIIMGVCGFCLFLWTQHSDAAGLGVGAIAVMSWTHRAHARVRSYRRWQNEWDAMGPGGGSGRAGGQRTVQYGGLLVVGLGIAFYLHSNGELPDAQAAQPLIGVGLLALLLAAAFWLGRGLLRLGGRFRRRKAATRQPVAPCVRQAIYRVPSLKDAYGALPAHCWRVLGGPGA